MAVINAQGIVLAHSDPEMVGRPFRKDNPIKHVGADFEENWEVITRSDGQRVFEVHRYFRPFPPGWRERGRGGMAMMPHLYKEKADDWFKPQQNRNQLIVVGLDMSPFESVIRGGIRSTVILSIIVILLGFAGFLSLFWMHSYRLAHRSLQDTSAFADEVVSHLPVGLIATDRSGRVAFFNAAAGRISGIEPSVALGQDPGKLLPPQLCGLENDLDSGIIIREKEMTCLFNGEKVPVSISAARIINVDGEDVGRILILRDLVEVRRLQAEIRRQEKLAAIGGLAAGVAHEIRNPLSSIKGLATYFGEKFPVDSEDRNLAGVMIQEVDRLNRVINELLEFARPTDLKRRNYDMNMLIRHCLQLVKQDAADKQIAVHTQLVENICMIYVDPDRLSQCLLNLFLNAIEAMASGGQLTVRSSQEIDDHVRVQVADTGPGIEAHNLENIFNPYFTTKSKGTGLGLAIVHKIVTAHGGHIQVESTPGKGTCFGLTFPCGNHDMESD